MSSRLFFWRLLVVMAVIFALVGTSHLVWAGEKCSSSQAGNKGYLYIRTGEETIKAKARLQEKEAKKKAPRVRKERPPKMKWIDIHFETGKADITSPNTFKLNRAARLLKINGQKEVLIIGSADRRGGTESNYALGLKRAKAGKDYLVKLGVAAERLKVKSLGEQGASKELGIEPLARDRCAKFQVVLAGRKKK